MTQTILTTDLKFIIRTQDKVQKFFEWYKGVFKKDFKGLKNYAKGAYEFPLVIWNIDEYGFCEHQGVPNKNIPYENFKRIKEVYEFFEKQAVDIDVLLNYKNYPEHYL